MTTTKGTKIHEKRSAFGTTARQKRIHCHWNFCSLAFC